MLLAIPAEIVLMIAILLIIALAAVAFIFYAGAKHIEKTQRDPRQGNEPERKAGLND